jgi:hypothetical protein
MGLLKPLFGQQYFIFIWDFGQKLGKYHATTLRPHKKSFYILI